MQEEEFQATRLYWRKAKWEVCRRIAYVGEKKVDLNVPPVCRRDAQKVRKT